jgi:hypothetical protein|tara:strand:+ start:12011 stop:12325 length:315 start_codon:yes stop_codon:yes gene_type:complete
MNLIDKLNQEIAELDREINNLEMSVLDDDKETPKPPKRKRGRPAIVENKIFVEMWNAALENGSLESVASSLGISPQSCSVKACNMRKAGHNLPQFKRGRRKKMQ